VSFAGLAFSYLEGYMIEWLAPNGHKREVEEVFCMFAIFNRLQVLVAALVMAVGLGASGQDAAAGRAVSSSDQAAVRDIALTPIAPPTAMTRFVRAEPRPVLMPWIQVLLGFETAPADKSVASRWSDDLEIVWTVALIDRRRGSPTMNRPVYLRRTVRYANVDLARRTHYAAVFLAPRFLQRYGYETQPPAVGDVLVYADLRVGGVLQTGSSAKITRERFKGPNDWWRMSGITFLDAGNLKCHQESPFFLYDQEILEEEVVTKGRDS
jgi:hypothetical protein